MFSDSIRDRFKFFFLSGSYTLGVFNDGFFRNSAILLAIGLSQSDSSMKGMEGIISFLFTVPYLLFSSFAGWLADRYPKRRVIVLALNKRQTLLTLLLTVRLLPSLRLKRH